MYTLSDGVVRFWKPNDLGLLWNSGNVSVIMCVCVCASLSPFESLKSASSLSILRVGVLDLLYFSNALLKGAPIIYITWQEGGRVWWLCGSGGSHRFPNTSITKPFFLVIFGHQKWTKGEEQWASGLGLGWSGAQKSAWSRGIIYGSSLLKRQKIYHSW